MTLKEAHELQRRELISLRAKVARLEKQTTGLIPVEEKEQLERSNRHLKSQYDSLQKRFNTAISDYSKTIKTLENINRDLDIQNMELERNIKELSSANEQLLARATKAEEEVAIDTGISTNYTTPP